MCGCATKSGRWYPIIGLGFVVISTNQPKATVMKATLIGGGITTLPPAVLVGFSRSSTALVTTNANVMIDLK